MVNTKAGVELELFEYDRALETYRSRYDEKTTSASMAVVATLSKVTGKGPMELKPLGESIDTDALDQFFHNHSGTRRNISTEFTTEGYTITVYDSSEITVALKEDGQNGGLTGELETR